jgi:hypothetical protein
MMMMKIHQKALGDDHAKTLQKMDLPIGVRVAMRQKSKLHPINIFKGLVKTLNRLRNRIKEADLRMTLAHLQVLAHLMFLRNDQLKFPLLAMIYLRRVRKISSIMKRDVVRIHVFVDR